MIRKIAMGLVCVFVFVGAKGAAAEVLTWDWPSESSPHRGECFVRTCNAMDETTRANNGAPCSEGAYGEKCVVAFEYRISGRIADHPVCQGVVPASRCGTYREDVSDRVWDVFNEDGTINEWTRWKYRMRVRSVACDGTRSDWVTQVSGDGTSCSDVSVGDVNTDGVIDLEDVVSLLQYLFFAGPAPECIHAADVNQNGIIGLFDAFELHRSLPTE